MKFDEVLRRFTAFFEAEGIRYALAGGNALLAWGLQRLTHDVDFAIDGTRRDEVVANAESLGYETTFVSDGYSNHYHGVDQDKVQEYFSQHGLLKIYDELEKERR